MNEQNKMSDNTAPKGPGAALKYTLIAFVAVSAGAIVYKIAAKPVGLQPAPAETAAVQEAAPLPAKPAGAASKSRVKPAAEAKTAAVYYFYTNTRCSSCKAIEEYTKAAVEKNFTADYNGWKVVFKGVNVDDEANSHFVQDYFLNSKSVVVQKFAGEKALKWAKLEKIWQLLGDKEAFTGYITAETRKLLDEK